MKKGPMFGIIALALLGFFIFCAIMLTKTAEASFKKCEQEGIPKNKCDRNNGIWIGLGIVSFLAFAGTGFYAFAKIAEEFKNSE